ncbi:MAG: hypothetical protein LH624_02660 [Cryobacterium sp.]|nr:hypothetical protein [Cryobacterium sp.]
MAAGLSRVRQSGDFRDGQHGADMTMYLTNGCRRVAMLSACILFSFLSAPAIGQAAIAQGQKNTLGDLQWYWTTANVERTLVRDGLDWAEGHDRIMRSTCTGLGDGIVSGASRLYKDFYCGVRAAAGSPYRIILHAASEETYRFTFAGWKRPQQWWWPTQFAADQLINFGLNWTTSFHPLIASTCSQFGSSRLIENVRLFKLFFCTVTPSTGYSYSVVVHATDESRLKAYFVTYTLDLPVTEMDTTPEPSSFNTTEEQQTQIMLRNQDDRLLLQTVQSQYLSTYKVTSAYGEGMFGGSTCVWPVC